MSQVEQRILELYFDNDNFERSVKTSMDTLDELQRKLEMKNGTDGLDKVEKKANGISFKGLETGISDAAGKFTAFEISANDDLDSVENKADRFSVKSLISAIGDAALKFTGFKNSAQGDVGDVQESVEDFTIQNIASQLEELSGKFTTLGIVGMSVLSELTREAMSFGKSMLGKVIDPILAGGKNRAFAIENAHFSLQGLISDEKEVQAIMQDALDSVDGTAYAYNDAASAAAQFAATGIRSGPKMQQTLRGIAGVAATTNAEYSEISHIFTTVAGNGRLMTEQLNQFSYRGMNAAASLTNAFNDVLNGSSNLSKEMQEHIRAVVQDGMENIKDFGGSLEGITEGDLRQLVSKGKIDFDTFSQIMADTFGEHAKDANKTFNGSMSNIRSALARTGAMFYTGLIAQEGPLVKMFNSIRLAVNAFNKVLIPLAENWTQVVSKLAEGVSEVVDAFVNNNGMAGVGTLIEGFIDILKTLGEAAADVFGIGNWNIKDTVGQAAKDFQEWAKAIKPTESQLETLKRVASGVFAGIKIGGKVVGSIVSVFGRFLSALEPFGQVLVNIAADFGDWLVSVSDFLDQSDVLNSVVDGLGGVFDTLGTFIGSAADAIYTFFKYITDGIKDLGIFDKLGERVSNRFNALKSSGNGFSGVLEKIKEKFSFLQPIFENIGSALSEFGNSIKDALTNALSTGDFSGITSIINEGLFAGLVLAFTNFVHSLSKPGEELAGLFKTLSSIPKSIGDSFTLLVQALKGGEQLNANNLIKLAVAIGLLAVSLLLISQLDLQSMAIGLTGIAGVMAEFAVFMKILPKVAKGMTKMKGMTRLAAQLVILAIAIDIMASAMKKIAKLDYEEVVRGIVGLGSAMAILVSGAKGLSKMSGSLKGVAGKLILLAAALTILVIPVKAFAKLSLNDLAKGLIGLAVSATALGLLARALNGIKVKTSTAVSLLLLAAALSAMAKPVTVMAKLSFKELVKGLGAVAVMLVELGAFARLVKSDKLMATSVSMVVLGAALKIFAGVVTKLSSIPFASLVKGILALGAILVELGLFANLVKPEKLGTTSAAMVILGASMEILADVISKFGNMSVKQLAKGLITIAASLAIFAGACFFMKDAMPGAMAISTIAGALVPLAFALERLAKIPILGLVAGLVAIAATFAIFGVASTVLSPMLPALLGLAATLAVLGLACLAAGVGIGVAATGIAMLAAAFTAGGSALVAVVTMLLTLLPFVFQQIALAIVAFLQGLADSIEQLKDSLIIIARGIIEVFVTLIPEVVNAILQLVLAIVTSLAEHVPDIANAVLQFIGGLLQAVADNIQSIVEAGVSIVVNFVNGIANSLGSVIDAAFNLVISFINGLADAIRNNHQALFDAVGNLITAIVEAIADGILSVVTAAGDLISGFFQGIEDFDPIGKITEIAGNIVQGFIDGITGMLNGAIDAAAGLGEAALNGLKSNSAEYGNAGAAQSNSFVTNVRSKFEDARQAGTTVTSNTVEGLKSNSMAYGTTGTTQANSFVLNVHNQMGAARQAGSTVTNNAVSGLKSNASEYSSTGSASGINFVGGISSNNWHGSYQKGKNLAGKAKDGAKSVSLSSVGSDAGQGFANGLRGKLQAVKDAAGAIANAAASKIKSFLGIGSPSRLFKQYGVWADQGLANGFMAAIPTVVDATERVGAMSVDSFTKAINPLSGVDLNLLDINAEPTITPVVDMSNVVAARRQLEDIFDQAAVLSNLDNMSQSIARSFNGVDISDGSEVNKAGTVINQTFNQVNNSPKALTTLEIYRRTKSLMAQVKGEEVLLANAQKRIS